MPLNASAPLRNCPLLLEKRRKHMQRTFAAASCSGVHVLSSDSFVTSDNPEMIQQLGGLRSSDVVKLKHEVLFSVGVSRKS